jgi:hypothetical protein
LRRFVFKGLYDTKFQGALSPSFPLIVFCHLRWEVSCGNARSSSIRVLQKKRVLFVEAPQTEAGEFEPHYTLKSRPNTRRDGESAL